MTVAAAEKGTYNVRQLETHEQAAALDVMRRALGESETTKRTEAMWNWKHVNNPFGRSHTLVAVTEEGRIIGLRAFMRWAFMRGDQRLSAVRAVDTATDPDFQRMGIFSRLTKKAIEDVRSQGTHMVFNTPNAQSGPGYLKLGWKEVGLVQPLVKVLNYPAVAAKTVKTKLLKRPVRRYEFSEFFGKSMPVHASILANDTRLPELIRKNSQLQGDRICTASSVDYVKWRYADHPTIDYRIVRAESESELLGCAIFRTNTRFGMKEVVISELMVADRNAGIAMELLSSIRRVVKADYLIAYFGDGSVQLEALRRTGFRRVPRQGMDLVVNPLQTGLPPVFELENWGVAMGDLEFF